MSTIQEIEERRAARKAELAAKKAAQAATDLEALDALEVEHGDDSVAAIEVGRYVENLPTMAVIRAPSAAEYKRFSDQIAKSVQKDNAQQRREAAAMLAASIVVYPADAGARASLFDAFPGLVNSIVIEATKLVEGKAREEGKG